MTIGVNNRNDAVGNGSTAVYPYGFKIFAATDLEVAVRSPADVETVLTYPTHYSVSGVGAAAGGNATLAGSGNAWQDASGFLEDGWAITIRRVRPITQTTDIRNQGSYFASSHEDAFDHMVMICQQQQDELDRSLKLPRTEDGSYDLSTIPAFETRKGKLFGFDPITGFPTVYNATATVYGVLRDYHVATAGQTVFNLGYSYSRGVNAMAVFVNGIRQRISSDFTESAVDQVTFTSGLSDGDEVEFFAGQEQGAAIGNASAVTYDPAGTGAASTSVQAKLREMISVKDFGAVGDGVTDDSDAFIAAMDSLTNGGGVIYVPPGEYIINSAIVIEPAVATNFASNIHFIGAGGHHTNIATRIWLLGGDATHAGLTLKSVVQMSFEHIDFVGASSMLALIKIQAAGAAPYYSSFNVAFRHCRFASTTPVNATMWINNSSNISFEQCFFQGAAIAVQIGSNAADSENSGTFSGGTADQISFKQTFISGDIVNYRTRGQSYDSCIFDENTVIGGRGVRIYAAGDQLVRGLNLQNCWAGFGDDTATFLTLGTSGYGLTMINNYVATYNKAVVLDGVGVAHIEGNEFALNSSGAIGIHITATGFYGDKIQNNHWSGMHASAYRITDARANPGTPPNLAPFEVNDNLTVDYTMASAGVGYEDVMTESVEITGGLYRIQAMMYIVNGATATEYRARVNFDSVNPRVAGTVYIPANQSGMITIVRDVLLDGLNAATTARLQMYQLTGPNAGTIKATDTTKTTMMQITRIG